MYDLIIIGAGPAGTAAGIYAAQNHLKTLILTKALLPWREGESGLLDLGELEKKIRGSLKPQAEFVDMLEKEEVAELEKNVVSFAVETKKGGMYYSRAVIIATGRDEKSGEANTFFDSLTLKDYNGGIKVNAEMKTNVPGIFAAGSVSAAFAADMFTAAGDGAKAALAALRLLNRPKP